MPIIQLENVRKIYRTARRSDRARGLRRFRWRSYDEVEALKGVTFSVEPGECVGYIGPNGAGKSTTIKVMTGILVPTSGQVTVDGLVPWQQRRRNARQIGVVFGQRTQLYWDLPLAETFELLRHIYLVPTERYRQTMADLDRLLGLSEFLHVPVRQLSLGQRMRGDLAAALLHGPRMLYLDEPTIGLDVVAKEHVLGFIRQINRVRGVTVILATHDLAEVERLCPRILLIDHGRLLYDGTVEGLRRRYAPWRTLALQFVGPVPARVVVDADEVARDGQTVWLRIPADRSPYDVIQAIPPDAGIRNLAVQDPTLEEIIKDLYGARGGVPVPG